ncbi:uncharacterized protein [Hetaerina americana]|uniref:uncharacterized protein n=1 Tax=Hetaerina americana TaxID=62018 RepID=UPI003A7F2C28
MVENTHAINHVAMRVPPFYPEKPQLWFAQLEGNFHLAGITEDTDKFWVVVAKLDTRYAQEVEDIIVNPPLTDKYKRLREELVRRVLPSEEQRIKQLLGNEDMGDHRPSQFLRQLRSLAGGAVPDDILRTIWLSRLPRPVHAILVTQASASLADLATLADKVAEVTHSLYAATVAPDPVISTLMEKIENLSQQVAALANKRGQHSHPLSRGRTPPLHQSSINSQRDQGICWYHRRWGSNANKCTLPCSYDAGKRSGQSLGAAGHCLDLSNRLFAKIPEIIPSGAPRQVKHSTVPFIETAPGPPVSSRPRGLTPDKLATTKKVNAVRAFPLPATVRQLRQGLRRL